MTEHTTEILRLTNAPIIDFVCEMRFESTVPRLSDILAKSLTDNFSDLIGPAARRGVDLPFSLPAGLEVAFGGQIAQLVFGDGTNINLAERAVGFGATGSYRGWEELRPRIESVFRVILESSLITKMTRCSVKYTNFFPGQSVSIEDVLAARLVLGDRSIRTEGTQIRTEFTEDDNIAIVQILNPVTVEGRADDAQGLLLDIDCIRNFNLPCNVESLMIQVDAVRAFEKKVFFSLLSKDALTAMGPVYA